MSDQRRGVVPLSAKMGSLARGLPIDVPIDTLFILTHHGGIQVSPDCNRVVTFGRNRKAVDVCIGENDSGISREHGRITYEERCWWVQNVGRIPIRFPGSQLLLTGHHEALPRAYTPLFIRTDIEREHLLEIRVAGQREPTTLSRPDQETRLPRLWRLEQSEKLALVVLGQRYLRHEPNPQPLSWAEAASQLAETQPDAGWTRKAVEHRVRDVRLRLAGAGIPGLTEREVPRPVGNSLNHNLLMELLSSTTLVPPDLNLLGDEESWEYRAPS